MYIYDTILQMWHVYIIRCADDSLYTGTSLDPARRLGEHNDGKGSKAIRGKLPATLVYTQAFRTKGSALKREAAVKRLTRVQKLGLCGIMTLPAGWQAKTEES